MSVPQEIASLERQAMEETVMLCCVTANGENAVGQPALIFILKQVSLWDKKLS